MAGEHILVVDDEEDVLELVCYNLNKEGYKTTTASSSEETIKKAKASPPNLIVLDLMLPRVDGLEVCKELKNDSKTRHIPIVMLTAKGEESDIITGLEIGADDYVTKPFSPKVLLARNIDAQRKFSACFETKQVKKTYLVLVQGMVSETQGTINEPIGATGKKPGIMRIDEHHGKEAITDWRLLADFGAIALLAVSPVTGRTHQIRVHLPRAGMPLLIDPMYGSSSPLLLSDHKPDYKLGKFQEEKPLIERLTLHAYQLEFLTSQGNYPDCFIAPLDKKFKAAIKMLTKYNPKGPSAFLNPDDFEKIVNGQQL